MTLPASGQISLSTVRTELSATGQLNLGGTSPRTLAGIASGTIGLSNFYGKTFAATYAFFGGGEGTHATVDKYKYTDSTTSSATSLTNGAMYFAAAGNTTQGVYGGGINSSYTRVNLTTRYTYAGNTTALLTSAEVTAAAPTCIQQMFIHMPAILLPEAVLLQQLQKIT